MTEFSAEKIKQLIRDFIADNILFSENGYPHPDDTSFLDVGVIDSMGVMELVMFAEETLDVTIDDGEVVPDNFDSIKKLSSFLYVKTNSSKKDPIS